MHWGFYYFFFLSRMSYYKIFVLLNFFIAVFYFVPCWNVRIFAFSAVSVLFRTKLCLTRKNLCLWNGQKYWRRNLSGFLKHTFRCDFQFLCLVGFWVGFFRANLCLILIKRWNGQKYWVHQKCIEPKLLVICYVYFIHPLFTTPLA